MRQGITAEITRRDVAARSFSVYDRVTFQALCVSERPRMSEITGNP